MARKGFIVGNCVVLGTILMSGQVYGAQSHTFSVGAAAANFEYEEAGLMKDEGVLYGLAGSYTYRGPLFGGSLQKAMLGVEARLLAGQVDYTSTNTGSVDNIDDTLFEIRGLGGYNFQVCTSTAVTPYIGLGYRYLNDDSAGKITTTGHSGYERRANYLYAPIGIKTVTSLQNDWSLGLNIEYDYFILGKQISLLSEVNPAYPDVEVDQEDGYGIRGAITISKMAGGLTYVVEPYVTYWDIDESERAVFPVGSFIVTAWEPKNESTEIGIKLAVEF